MGEDTAIPTADPPDPDAPAADLPQSDHTGREPEVEIPPDERLLNDAAETFAMLASPTRLHLLWLLARRPYDVGSLAEAVDTSDTAVSQHLAKLRMADLVTKRRKGKRQIYVVDDEHVSFLVDQALEHHAKKHH